MKLLLDTHVVIWALSDPERLSARARAALQDVANVVAVSAISAAELAIKQSLGKLQLPGPVAEWLPAALSAMSFVELPLTAQDAMRVGALPWHHRDPFDRLLIAQALGGWHFVTADHLLRLYDVPVFWD